MTTEEVGILVMTLFHHGFQLWVLVILAQLDLDFGVNGRSLLLALLLLHHCLHHRLPAPRRHPTPLETE